MVKVILNFSDADTEADIHRILKETLGFPEYYGENLDALYDCLTDLREDTAVGFCQRKDDSDAAVYLRKAQRVFLDAEEENPHLAVFFLSPA